MKNKFKEQIDLSVTAAQIGISNEHWDYADHSWSEEEVKHFMSSNSYDILPVKSDKVTFDSYWATKKLGSYDVIHNVAISQSENVYYLTELKDLLVKFNDSNSSSYFLTNHKEVNGLVSNVNLNSKPVYVYFYNLISSVEIDLGNWLKELIDEKEMIKTIVEKSKNTDDSLSSETINRYRADKKKNIDNHFVEYLYFSQFEFLLRKKKLVSALGFASKSKFATDFKIIKKYRNWFAHPLNSPKSNLSKDLLQLHQVLERLIGKVNSIDPSLLKAYFSTNYKTIDNPVFSITIGTVNKKLDTYLKKMNVVEWAFITAENPFSAKLSDEENKLRNTLLEKKIGELKSFKGIGLPADSNWDPENSYLVLGISLAVAKGLGKEFGQNAFVYGKVNEEPELIVLNKD